MSRTVRWAWAWALIGIPAAAEAPLPVIPAPTFANEKYDTRHERNVLDFWQAKTDKPAPVVLWFHGGGFKMGDKSAIADKESVVGGFLARGVSVASCNYPFVKDATYEEIMHHCARAVQFVRSKEKDWRIDPTRIGVAGSSAGALISEWLGYHADLADPKGETPASRLSSVPTVVGSHFQPMGTEELIFPHVRAGGPPIFIYSNAPPTDSVHHPKYAKMMKAKADELKITAEMWGGNRNDLPAMASGETYASLLLKFFCTHLGVR